jgi:hypothetical protein
MDNIIIFLSVYSGWMDVLEFLAYGMTRSGGGGDSAKAHLNSWSSTDAVSLSAISQLSCRNQKPT